MENQHRKRISLIQSAIADLKIHALIIPTADPHLSEYIADHWKYREWASGFTGSAGTLVITEKEAALWTDSRYYIQAEDQLAESGIILFRDGEVNTPSYTEWLCSKLNYCDIVGIDGRFFSIKGVKSLKDELDGKLIVKTNISMERLCLHKMPDLPHSNIYEYDKKYSGESVKDKLIRIRATLHKEGADTILLSSLDEIAWALNLRASDVTYTPVAIAYALISMDKATLFTDSKVEVQLNSVEIRPYEEINSALRSLPQSTNIILDEEKTNYALYDEINELLSVKIISSPIGLMKAKKNETELGNIRSAMIKDGIALCHAFKKMEDIIAEKQTLTEIDVADLLREERSKEEGFVCESFATIAGFGPHGAIVHYSATAETNAEVKTDNLLLIDSGGNYLDGTTDVTRTLCFGIPTEEQKEDYTDVLKGHIAIAKAKFPVGTHGSQLDVLAKQFMWSRGLTYGHGTGHGVGHFLCVHEGPQAINRRDNGIALEKGMVLSDEPGLYRKGKYGIRIENMVCVRESNLTMDEFGSFLQFETLTLLPYERKLIKKENLTNEEKNWINSYHKKTYDLLAPHLDKETRSWLKNKTSEI